MQHTGLPGQVKPIEEFAETLKIMFVKIEGEKQTILDKFKTYVEEKFLNNKTKQEKIFNYFVIFSICTSYINNYFFFVRSLNYWC